MMLNFLHNRFAIVFLLSLVLSSCNDQPNVLLNTTSGKLAVIDAGHTSITENHVKPYRLLLSKLEAKCDDTTIGIADTAVTAKNIFKSKNNQDVSVFSVMRMIDNAVPDGEKLNCDEIISAIIALS